MDNQRQGINVRGSLYANLTPVKGLVITSRFGFRLGQSYSASYEDPYYANAKAYSDTYSVSSTTSNNYYYQWENFANYDKSFGKHNLSAMVGMSYIESRRFSNGGTITGTDPLTGYEPNFHYISFANASATRAFPAVSLQGLQALLISDVLHGTTTTVITFRPTSVLMHSTLQNSRCRTVGATSLHSLPDGPFPTSLSSRTMWTGT